MSARALVIAGGCHCGALRFTLEWPPGADPIPARRCNCGYCVRFNGTWTSNPGARLAITVSARAAPERYRFGTSTADFLFCGNCGVTVAALCETGEGLKAVVNVNTFDPEQDLRFDYSSHDFEGETAAERVARRTAGWIGSVTVR